MQERVSEDPNPWHFHLPLHEERKVIVLREAGKTHLPQDCCSHQLAFSHIPSFTWQALRAICAGTTDAQHSCRARTHQVCQVFYYGSTESKGGTQIPAWGRQQEGGESRICGKEAFSEHLIIAQHWMKLAGGQIPPPLILASVPPFPSPKAPLQSPRDTVDTVFRAVRSWREFDHALQLFHSHWLHLPFHYRAQSRQVTRAFGLDPSKHIFQESASGLGQCLTHSKP